MFKLIAYSALVSTFLVAVSCRDATESTENGDEKTIPEGCGGDPNAQTGCSNYCGHSCSDYNKHNVACPLFCIVNGCSCKKGFVYDPNVKKCVRPEDCTPECPKNEVFSACIKAECKALNCSQLGKPIACADVDQKDCKKGCICVNGYVRDQNGKCIPQDTCPEGCGGDPNAQTGCSNYCGHSCSDSDKPDVVCPLFCIVNGCSCKKGYVYDPNVKKCVRPEDCTPECPKNEVFSACIKAECKALNCSQLGKPIACADVDQNCKKGCICVNGYVRDQNGKCIPQDTCPEGCGGDPNAQTGCSNYCGHSCSNSDKPDVVCPLFCIVNGCSCKKGYVYDPNIKKCVRPEDCNKIECHRPHEVPKCVFDCPPEITCETRGIAYKCLRTDDMKCKQKCVCEENYYRNKIGECITGKQCDKCSGKNEYFSCGGACDNVCATLDTQNQTNCPIINIKCNEMCYCIEGTARNEDDDCVPIADCKKPWSNKSHT